jgi:EmrB/QacA subfamily drug resistance transporter
MTPPFRAATSHPQPKTGVNMTGPEDGPGGSADASSVNRQALALGGLALVVVLSAQLVVVLDFSIVNVALPSISGAFSATATSVQWVVTAYAITFGGLLVLGGRAADFFGRRRLFIWGLVGFAAASAAGGVATGLPLLIVARAVQGIAAAAVAPATLSILTTSFPDGPTRTRVLGYYGIMSSVGFVAGLVLGGLLVETVGWRGVFFVNVPICLLGAVVSRHIVPAGEATAAPSHLDLMGAGLVTAGVATLVYAPTAGVDDGWASAQFFVAIAAAAALLSTFIWQERRSPNPLVPLSIFRSRTLAAGDGVTLLIGAWNAGEVLILSLFFQEVLGYSPLRAGLLALPQGIGGLLRGFAGPRLVARVGIKRFLTASTAVAALGLALLLRFPATSRYPLLGVLLLLVGFGTTSAMFAATVAGTAGVTDDEQGLAGALVNTARQVGAALGIAVLLAVSADSTGANSGSNIALAASLRLAMGVSPALAVAAGLLSFFVIREGVCRAHHARLHRRHLDHPWPLPELLGHQGGLPPRPPRGLGRKRSST